MKEKIFYICLLVTLSACNQVANSSNGSPVESPQLIPEANPAVENKSISTTQPDQIWSNAPLSSGILLSRTDTATEKAEIYVMDPVNGLPIASAPPLPAGSYFSSIRTLDGKSLVTVAYPASNDPVGQLHFIDLTTWQDTLSDLSIDGYVGVLIFDPDGNYLMIISWKNGSHIYLVDMQSKKLAGQLELKNKFVKAQFTKDSVGVMIYMNQWDNAKNPEILPSVMLLDVPVLKVQWEKTLKGVRHGSFAITNTEDPSQPGLNVQFEPGIAFSPTEDKLYIIHADEDRLTIVDFGRQRVGTVNIIPKLSLFERLLWMDAQPVKAKMINGTVKSAVISPDGAYIYSTGITNKFNGSNSERDFESTPLGLQIIDTNSGEELEHYDIATQSLSLTPDGRWVLLYGYQAKDDFSESFTQVFDAQAQALKNRFEGTQLRPSQRLDGETVFVSQVFLPNGHQKLSIYDDHFIEINSFESKKFFLSWPIAPPGW